MGQFKPMVKMMTTEPTVELKLKKGGTVAMKKGGSTKVAKKADGGALGALATTPALVGRPAVNAPVRSPGRPPLAMRRRAMAGRPAAPMARPMMKDGGEAEESMAEHKAEMKKMAKTEKELKAHAAKPASKAHKGLATGGVVMGQGGYKKGGKVMKKAHGGIITEQEGSRDAGAYKNTMMHTAKPDHSPAKTGEVKLGNGGGYKTGGVAKSNAGGYKKGGASKKYAKGGSVNDSGKAVDMPQGQKKPSTPVSINQLSGTFKKGGQVMTPAQAKLEAIHKGENAPAMKAAKADSNEVYSKYGKMKMRNGGMC